MRNVPLTLVHVAVTPSWGPAPWLLSNDPLPVPADEDPALEKSTRKIITDAIKIAEDSTHGTDRPEIRSELFFSVPVPTLVDLSKDAQMVVVGRRGQHRLRGVLLGSVSTGMMHHAHCPVAVIGDVAPIGPQRLHTASSGLHRRVPCLGTAHRDRVRRGIMATCGLGRHTRLARSGPIKRHEHGMVCAAIDCEQKPG